MRTLRIYIDTSVLGAVFDDEFKGYRDIDILTPVEMAI